MNVWMAATTLVVALAGAATAAPVGDFTLPRPGTGDVFKLSEHRGQFVALHFLLKTECPVCLSHTQTYHTRAAELPGVVQVFIKPDSEEAIAAWTTKVGSEIPIWRDADAALAKTFSIPDGYAFHGEVVHYPALVLIDGRGEEVFRHVGKANTDRLPFDQLAAEVTKLRPDAPVKEYNLGADKLAIQGYDPVSYHSGKPLEGSPQFEVAYRGVRYHFANASNRDRFIADPEKYTPAYGGWCAYAMADGDKVSIDPGTFKIVDGKLNLFYNGWLGNTLPKWNKDEPGLKKRADTSWRGIAKE